MRIIIDPDPESLLPRKLGRRNPAGILLTFHQWKTLITENKPKLYNKTDDGEGIGVLLHETGNKMRTAVCFPRFRF